MSRQVVLPAPALRPYVRNLMLSGFDSLDIHLPAIVDVQIVIYLRGHSILSDGTAFATRVPTAFIAGPSLFPRRFRVEPGSRFIAATFRPSGFLSCFGIPVHSLAGQLAPLDSVVGNDEAVTLLEQLYHGENCGQLVGVLERFLLRRLLAGGKNESQLPVLPLERLLLPASELARGMDISTRQLERRFLACHGVSLRDYRRFARFATALASLMQGKARAGTLAHTALDARYADQAHFAKDFRQFVGDTPGRFLRERLRNDSAYKFWQLNADELRSYLD